MRDSVESRVSVVIPAYNSSFLEDAIGSVYAQTVAPAEVIVVNDGSTDDTEQCLRDLASRLPASFIWQTKENGGCASALNLGVRLSTGAYVAFLDHDDLWHPEKLEHQLMHFAARPDTALSFTEHSLIFGQSRGAVGTETRAHGGIERAVEVPYPWNPDPASVLEVLLTRQLPIATMSGVMVRRDVLARVGAFDETLITGHDVKMYLDVAASGWKIDYVPRTLVQYRWHAANLSRDGRVNRQSAWQIADAFYDAHASTLSRRLRRLAREWRARTHLVTAIDAIQEGDKTRARSHILRAARACPTSIRPGWLRMLGVGTPPA